MKKRKFEIAYALILAALAVVTILKTFKTN